MKRMRQNSQAVIDGHKSWLQNVSNSSRAVYADCNFDSVDFSGCNFRDADFICCKFEGAYLSGCNFKHANLSGSNFGSANMRGCDLTGCDLSDCELGEKKLYANDTHSFLFCDYYVVVYNDVYCASMNADSARLKWAGI